MLRKIRDSIREMRKELNTAFEEYFNNKYEAQYISEIASNVTPPLIGSLNLDALKLNLSLQGDFPLPLLKCNLEITNYYIFSSLTIISAAKTAYDIKRMRDGNPPSVHSFLNYIDQKIQNLDLNKDYLVNAIRGFKRKVKNLK